MTPKLIKFAIELQSAGQTDCSTKERRAEKNARMKSGLKIFNLFRRRAEITIPADND